MFRDNPNREYLEKYEIKKFLHLNANYFCIFNGIAHETKFGVLLKLIESNIFQSDI